jgi:hypothetical protein
LPNSKHLIVAESDKRIQEMNLKISQIDDEIRLVKKKESEMKIIGVCLAQGNVCNN